MGDLHDIKPATQGLMSFIITKSIALLSASFVTGFGITCGYFVALQLFS